MGAWWSNGGLVEVVGTTDLGPSGELGVDAGATQKVKGEQSLGEQAVPQMEGKGLVSAAEASDEMVLECPDGSFSRVAAMHAGWGQLEVNGLFMEEVFEYLGAFIIKAEQFGTEAMGCEEGMGSLMGCKDGASLAVGNGFGMDVVAIIAVENKHIVVALTRGEEEAACLVGEYLACGFNGGSEAVVSLGIAWVTGWERVLEILGSRSWWRLGDWCLGFGRAGVLASLV